ECEKRGQDLLLVTHTSRRPEKRSVFVNGANRMDFADGAILFGMESDKREIVKLRDDGYPFVFIGRREVEGQAMPAVITGYVQATKQNTAAMLEAGHATFAYLGLPLDREYTADRETGFRSALAEHGRRAEGIVWRASPAALDRDVIEDLFAKGVTAYVAETPEYVRRL